MSYFRTKHVIVSTMLLSIWGLAGCERELAVDTGDSSIADTSSEDSSSEDTSVDDSESTDTAIEDTGSEDSSVEGSDSLDTAIEDTGSEDSSVEDSDSLDTGDSDTGEIEPLLYSVGGVVDGLVGMLVIQNNGGDELYFAEDALFTFSVLLESGADYNVTIIESPPGQYCTITNGTGIIEDEDVGNVFVECITVIPQ